MPQGGTPLPYIIYRDQSESSVHFCSVAPGIIDDAHNTDDIVVHSPVRVY